MELGLGIVAVLAWAPKLVLCALLLIFGHKTGRSCRLKSLPWLGVYIIASVVLPLAFARLLGQALDTLGMDRVPFGWTLENLSLLTFGGAFFSNSAKLVLCLLILSDIAFLVSKAGAAVEGGFLNRLIRVRDRSTTWGSVMLLLLLSEAALGLSLYLYHA